MSKPRGSVLIVGGGIAGVQAALDLADSGFYVHLVEKTAAIGGSMSQLDKTFPTNDCSACILSPKLVEAGRHLNIQLLTLSDILSIEGEAGDFKVRVRQNPRYVDPQKCIACGTCAGKCPKKVPNEFDLGLGQRKAIYLKYPQAVPLKYVIDPNHCIYLNKPGRCGFCKKVCPTGAINFDDKPKELTLEVGSVILSLGYRPFDPSGLDYTGYARFKNVITSMEFERLLSPSGPYRGHLKRPSDGTEPKRIAWLQCIGSRDLNRVCHGYCSSVCCMYAIKQSVIAKEHAQSRDLETSIFYMDIRTHGKGFEAYYQRAERDGTRFCRARVHTICQVDNDNLVLRYVEQDGGVKEEEFDLVILSVGLEADPSAMSLAREMGVELDADNFVKTEPFTPVETNRPGIYVCGAFKEPKDIPQSVMEASAAACEAEKLLHEARWTETKEKEFPPERNIYAEPPRIGVFVCSCGINIASVVDVKAVTEYAKGLPGVVFAQNNLFTCSQDSINQMVKIIKEQRLNRVVVASCTPRTHEPLFQETLREAGLNKFLFEMANIRDQDSWVHQMWPEKATEKAKDLVRMAVAKVRGDEALPYNQLPVTKRALVIGAGVAGMTAALDLARQGFPVTLVERKDRLGGHARKFYRTWHGHPMQDYLVQLIDEVKSHPLIDLRLETTIEEVSGSVGQFKTRLSKGDEVEHGVAILAVGAESYKPRQGKWNYLYGKHPGVHTLLELDQRFIKDDPGLRGLSQAVFIHCVGSRVPERPYCSRVCCTHAIDQALKLKELNPDMEIFMLYRDIRTYGQREHIYHEALSKGIIFIRYDLEHLPVVQENEGSLVVEVDEPIIKRKIRLHPDLLILASAVRPRDDVGQLSKFFKCAMTEEGFLLEAHMKLRPVDFATDGVYLAGLCHYPKPVEETISQAKAAASRAALVLSKDSVPTESITAVVNPFKCTGCGVCTQVCAYKAVTIEPGMKAATVDSGTCKGCGACVAGCRSDAITIKNLGNEQILAAVEAAMEE